MLERTISACRAGPTAVDWFDLPGLLDELAEVYHQLGRVDDALAAMRAAIDAGYAGSPDPRCRLAEIMLRAGRTESAAQVYTQVKVLNADFLSVARAETCQWPMPDKLVVGQPLSWRAGWSDNGLLSGGSIPGQHWGRRERSVGAMREPHVIRYIDPRRPTSLAIQTREDY